MARKVSSIDLLAYRARKTNNRNGGIMMKAISFFAVAVCLICVASVSAAQIQDREHTIKKGDSIYTVAVQVFHLPWGSVKKEMREKELIYPGMVIRLSDMIDLDAEFPWGEAGSNEFRKYPDNNHRQLDRDEKALRMMIEYGVPAEFVERVSEKNQEVASDKSVQGFEWVTIQKGDRFDLMFFGEFLIRENVVVEFERTIAARKYSLLVNEGEDRIKLFEIFQPLICTNWALRISVVQQQPRPQLIEPLVTPTLAPLEPVVIEPEEESSFPLWQWDLVGGTFQRDWNRGVWDTGRWLYTSIRYKTVDEEGGAQYFGVCATVSDYDGAWQNSVYFNGKRKAAGAEHRYIFPENVELQTRLYFFEEENYGRDTLQKDTDRFFTGLALEFTIDDYHRWNKKWLTRWNASFGVEKQISSEWDIRGGTIGERPRNRDLNINAVKAGVSINYLTLFNKRVTLWADAWGQYKHNRDRTGQVSLMVGVLQDSVRLGCRWWRANLDGLGYRGQDGFVLEVNPRALYEDYWKRSGDAKRVRSWWKRLWNGESAEPVIPGSVPREYADPLGTMFNE